MKLFAVAVAVLVASIVTQSEAGFHSYAPVIHSVPVVHHAPVIKHVAYHAPVVHAVKYPVLPVIKSYPVVKTFGYGHHLGHHHYHGGYLGGYHFH